jgi:hypothetical protein
VPAIFRLSTKLRLARVADRPFRRVPLGQIHVRNNHTSRVIRREVPVGRVTMAVESGLVRRIYLRDRPPAGALDVSRSGTSIGRWDGTTLVVETTGLDPNARVVPGSVLGPDARVVERIALVDAETLRIETTVTAPTLLSAPRSIRQVYRRARERVFTDFDPCVEGDRSYDRATGQDRFVKTPPAGLPPPPKD